MLMGWGLGLCLGASVLDVQGLGSGGRGGGGGGGLGGFWGFGLLATKEQRAVIDCNRAAAVPLGTIFMCRTWARMSCIGVVWVQFLGFAG